jgi:hypothetical protein
VNRLRPYVPLGFVPPAVVVRYGIVIARRCVTRVNELTTRFGLALLRACSPTWLAKEQ